MKRSWLILLMVLSFTYAQAQKNKCSCEAFLSTTFTGAEMVYEEASRTTEVYAITNHPLEEDFIHLTIIAQKGDALQVAPFGIENYYDTGWINNSHVAVYGTNYIEPISIYKKADTSSQVLATIRVGYEPEYAVVGCKGRWLQVVVVYNNEELSGWLAPKDQCGSAYTNCN